MAPHIIVKSVMKNIFLTVSSCEIVLLSMHKKKKTSGWKSSFSCHFWLLVRDIQNLVVTSMITYLQWKSSAPHELSSLHALTL